MFCSEVLLLVFRTVQSELDGNKELIGLMSQIGANTKDVGARGTDDVCVSMG